jgi:drug/metabolite transporter (DMT)-like permease
VTVVLQVTPLAVIAGSSILYGEKVSWRRWAAALTGFLGVVLIVRPGGGSFGAAVYVLLTALLFTTTRDLTTRGLSHDIPSIFVAAASSAAIALAGLVLAPFDDAWVIPSTWTWGAMMISAVWLFVANTFMIMALRTGEIAVVAPFRYAPVPLAVLLGYLWWEDLPDTLGFVGTGLVLGAGLYTLHRERAGLRAPAVPVPQRSPAE